MESPTLSHQPCSPVHGGDRELARVVGAGMFLDGAGAGAPLEAAVFLAQSMRGSGEGREHTLGNTEKHRDRQMEELRM